MGSAIPPGALAEIVRAARERTGVPGVAAGLLVDGRAELAADGETVLGCGEAVTAETPFRVASVSKMFTSSLAVSCLDLEEPLLPGDATARMLLSHTAGLRQESAEPVPEAAAGLWSYSNAGYWAVGEACARACGGSFADAMRGRILEPLGLAATGYDEPARPARGHVQEGETGHRAVPTDAYPVARHASGGIWSTVADLLRFAEHQLGGPGPLGPAELEALREPQAEALGASYGLGRWVRELEGGRVALDHEGSVGGYQTILLLVPGQRLALAVLTNSWRGSGLIRRVVEALGLVPARDAAAHGEQAPGDELTGRYALDGTEAEIEAAAGGLRLREAEVDPVTGARLASPAYPARPLGGGVYGLAGGLLMTHRLDFPRPGVARVSWIVLPRTGS